jgi:hypothetical protein
VKAIAGDALRVALVQPRRRLVGGDVELGGGKRVV